MEQRKHYLIDQRVEIPAHYDEWMQGDRFGTVIGVRRNNSRDVWAVSVRLDKSKREVLVTMKALNQGHGRVLITSAEQDAALNESEQT